jgi:hypothetical protein
MFDRGCTGNDTCGQGLHQINCCGTKQAIGFNHAQTTAFDAAESAWEMTCPACGCAEGPTTDDEGKTCDPGKMPTVSCDNGECHTHC